MAGELKCPECGGAAMLLGELGGAQCFRCRQCGRDWQMRSGVPALRAVLPADVCGWCAPEPCRCPKPKKKRKKKNPTSDERAQRAAREGDLRTFDREKARLGQPAYRLDLLEREVEAEVRAVLSPQKRRAGHSGIELTPAILARLARRMALVAATQQQIQEHLAAVPAGRGFADAVYVEETDYYADLSDAIERELQVQAGLHAVPWFDPGDAPLYTNFRQALYVELRRLLVAMGLHDPGKVKFKRPRRLRPRQQNPRGSRSMDERVRAAERACAAGDKQACGALIRARVQAGIVHPEWVRWADALLWAPQEAAGLSYGTRDVTRLACPYEAELGLIASELHGPPDPEHERGRILWHVQPSLVGYDPHSYVVHIFGTHAGPWALFESAGSTHGPYQVQVYDAPGSREEERELRKLNREFSKVRPDAPVRGAARDDVAALWWVYDRSKSCVPAALAYLTFLLLWNPLEGWAVFHAWRLPSGDMAYRPRGEQLRQENALAVLELVSHLLGGAPL